MARYLPLTVSLEGRRCVVVGGGEIAARRVAALQEAGGRVCVIAPAAIPAILDLAAAKDIDLHLAKYDPTLLDGATLVVAATDSDEVNARVARDAAERGLLCNDTDEPERGDTLFPAVLRRGHLTIAVTTLGASPALAARIRKELAERYGAEYEAYVDLLRELRERVLHDEPDAQRRRARLRAAVEDDTLLDLIRQGRLEEARLRAFTCTLSPSD